MTVDDVGQKISIDVPVPAHAPDQPVFTYVADGIGTCAECHLSFRQGATVVRVGVTCGTNGSGWRQYHLDCYYARMEDPCS